MATALIALVTLTATLAPIAPGTASAAAAPAPAGSYSDHPGPIAVGYRGPAYVVPTGTDAAHPDAVAATRPGSADPLYLPSGSAFPVRPLRGHPDRVTVGLPYGAGTATAPRAAFWAMPAFVGLANLTVDVGGTKRVLGLSGLRYHRGNVATFTDPQTKTFDGLVNTNRDFLACRRPNWGIGAQTFAVDLIEDGVHRRDRTLFERGIQAMDWGVAVPINQRGIHVLHRDCDGKTVADYGYTHHTTQWLESLGRATYLVAASPWAGEYRAKLDAYRKRANQVATLLSKPAVYAYWKSKLHNDHGNPYTHRAFMRAAALGLASTLATNRRDAARWAAGARTIARVGQGLQRPDGVNPERGGFDVLYQMYGTWLAELYDGTLPRSSPMQRSLAHTIDKAIAWYRTRVRPNGQIRIEGTTRVCVEELWSKGAPLPAVDPAEAIRALLLWGMVRHGDALIRLAERLDQGQKRYGNDCPTTYHAKPEPYTHGTRAPKTPPKS